MNKFTDSSADAQAFRAIHFQSLFIEISRCVRKLRTAPSLIGYTYKNGAISYQDCAIRCYSSSFYAAPTAKMKLCSTAHCDGDLNANSISHRLNMPSFCQKTPLILSGANE